MKKKEKIFFIYPPSVIMDREDRAQKPILDSAVSLPLPPEDMMCLSAIAKKRGYETKFKDYSLNSENVYDFLRDLRVFKPDFIVLNVASVTLEKDLSILTQAQEFLEDTVVIVKGAIFNFNSYSIMQKYPEIDIALRGDIEEAFDEIIQYRNLKDIKGITYQTNGKIFQMPDRKPKENLDSLPFLDRDLIENEAYVCQDGKKPQTVIRVSKGCPYNCFFCLATPLNGKKARYKSPEFVVEEIKECARKYNIYDFVFLADIFNLDNDWVKSLCNLILKLDFKIRFSTNTRIDAIDFEVLKLMKKAGCELLTVGIESGSQEILDKIGKNITIEQIKNAVSMIENSSIRTHACYVLGLPWETKETINQTFKFAKELNTDFASFHTAAPLLGSRFYEYIKKNRLGEINYEKPYYFPGVRSYDLNAEEIYSYNKKFNKEYYLRAKHILKMTTKAQSPSKFKTYCNTFLKLVKNR